VRDHAAMLRPPSRAAALNGRERAVAALIAGGMSRAGIAQRVVLSALTAQTHASPAMTKAAAHGATIVLTDAEEGGTRAVVTMGGTADAGGETTVRSV
jgi:DNA-binding NarL/FixJ family response regulator